MSEKKETSGRYPWNKSNKESANDAMVDDLIRLNKEIEENQKRINGLIELCDSLMDLQMDRNRYMNELLDDYLKNNK